MTLPAMTRWQARASNGRKTIGNVFLVLGKAAADDSAAKWVKALGKPWTLVSVEPVREGMAA